MTVKTIRAKRTRVAKESARISPEAKNAPVMPPTNSDQKKILVEGQTSLSAQKSSSQGIVDTVPTYINQPTDNPHLFRVVDREGNWTHYWHDQLGYLPSVNHIIGLGFPKGEGLIRWLKRLPEDESDRILRAAGERGRKVHDAIRKLTAGERVHYADKFANDKGIFEVLTPDEWDCLVSWVTWVSDFQPKVLRYETSLFHPKRRYAGTMDFLGSICLRKGIKVSLDDKFTTIREDVRVEVLLDYKTGSTIHDDHRLQVAAYDACLDERADFTGILRIGTAHKNGGYELKLWSRDKTKQHLKYFWMAKGIYEMNNKSWIPEIAQQPAILQVTL